MSSQANHPALLIPGPIEFDDAVLQSMSHYRLVDHPYTSSAMLSISSALDWTDGPSITAKAMLELPLLQSSERHFPC